MKKLRGLRLGRKLVRLCRHLICRRRRPRRAAYIRLGALTSASYPPPRAAAPSSALYASPASTHHKQSTVTGKLFGWGSNLWRRPFASGGWFHRNPHASAGRYDRGGPDATSQQAAKLLPPDSYRRRPPQNPWKPPKGHLVVYVGKGGSDGGPPPHRVLLPVIYFNHPLFGDLLREAEQEYGFHHPGGITIPCPISDFESVRDRVAAAASDLHVRTASGRIWRWHS